MGIFDFLKRKDKAAFTDPSQRPVGGAREGAASSIDTKLEKVAVDELVHGFIIPGSALRLRDKLFLLPESYSMREISLRRPGEEYVHNDFSVQLYFLRAQACGWVSPPFVEGQPFPGAAAFELASLLSKQLGAGEFNDFDGSEALFTQFARRGSFVPSLLGKAAFTDWKSARIITQGSFLDGG